MPVQKHAGRGGQGRPLAKIDRGILAVGQVDRHEAPAAQIAAARVSDGKGVTDGHGRIDRIAALAQNGRTDFRGEVLRSHDHAGVGFHRLRGGRRRRGGYGLGRPQGQRGPVRRARRYNHVVTIMPWLRVMSFCLQNSEATARGARRAGG